MVDKKINKKESKILLYFAVALLVVSLIIFSANLLKISQVTGKAIGTANLTVESKTSINFTTNTIDWGVGNVEGGKASATLNTAAGTSNISDGNWTGNTAGLVIENIGNQNATLQIKTAKNATVLLGGTNPDYEYNVSMVEDGSCRNVSFGLGLFYDVNVTDPGTQVCDDFPANDSIDTIRIDIKLVIPSDATNTGSATGDIVTATATAL